MAEPTLLIRQFGLRDYEPVWREMQRFTDLRDQETGDELWLVQHPPVFTLGLNGKPEHLLAPGVIPVVAIDRGGQVTYHGPGQQLVYLLLDLKRNRLGIRAVVEKIEQAIIRLLADYAIAARSRRDAPGVYVGDSKIAALGLRVRRGCCYHGLALNINMDLEPFTRINPCGYPGMVVTQLSDLIDQNSGPADATHIAPALCRYLAEELGYTGTVQP